MSNFLKNKKKIETIFEHGKTIKEKGLLLKFYEFCSEKSTNNMIREAINFKF